MIDNISKTIRINSLKKMSLLEILELKEKESKELISLNPSYTKEYLINKFKRINK